MVRRLASIGKDVLGATAPGRCFGCTRNALAFCPHRWRGSPREHTVPALLEPQQQQQPAASSSQQLAAAAAASSSSSSSQQQPAAASSSSSSSSNNNNNKRQHADDGRQTAFHSVNTMEGARREWEHRRLFFTTQRLSRQRLPLGVLSDLKQGNTNNPHPHSCLPIDLEAKACLEPQRVGLADAAAAAFVAAAAGGGGAPLSLETSEALAELHASQQSPSPPQSYTLHSVADGCAKEAVEELVGRTQTPRSSTTCSGLTTHGPGVLPPSVEEGDLFGTVETLSQAQSCCFSATALDLGLDAPHAAPRTSGRNGAGALNTQADVAPANRQTYAPHNKLLGRLLRRCSVLHFLALFHSFVMIVSLWGILAVAVELLAAGSTTAQLSWYCGMLAAALSATLLLKLTERQGYACTFYPTLFAMLAMLVAAWGIIDVLVEHC
ncbi:hypothetical protein Emed_001887 [Eimeria media]